MKLLCYQPKNSEKENIGVLIKDTIYNLNAAFGNITMIDLIQLKDFKNQITKYLNCNDVQTCKMNEVSLLSPIPKPSSFRDAYSFRDHVETARRNRGLDMIPEFDVFPVFYFGNHNAILGPNDDVYCEKDHFEDLDYELEIAIVIGKKGKNILAKDALKYIAGVTILNDMSARKLQREEMKLNLGPAKGKDFANILGPYLVTLDEIDKKSFIDKNHIGKKYDLEMRCSINGEVISTGNMKTMHWTFSEIIERVSYGVEIYPGDIIGSGTVGGGCFLEINGSEKKKNNNYKERWINEGDIIEMEIEGIGKISNQIIRSNNNHSILK